LNNNIVIIIIGMG